jgi:PAS domain S-box-containing protein
MVRQPSDRQTGRGSPGRLSTRKREVQLKSAKARMRSDAALVGESGVPHAPTASVEPHDALRESEERFHTLADNIAQFAWMADPTGSIFWYNRRWYEYTGTTLDEMQGWGWTKVHHSDHVVRVVARISRSWETGEPWEDTFPLRARDGTYRWFLSRALPIRDQAGHIVRWFGTNTDVTEQRSAEEERALLLKAEHAARTDAEAARAAAEEAMRVRDEFIANVSHDLQSPLTAIKGHMQLLRRRVMERITDGDGLLATLETVERTAIHMSGLIRELMEPAGEQADLQAQLQRQPTDLVAIGGEVVDMG